MICRVENGQAGREGPQGRELKMGIIHVTIQIVPTDMICRVVTIKRGQAGQAGEVQQGRELKMGIIHVTIQIVPTDMICRVENVDKRDERDHRDEN